MSLTAAEIAAVVEELLPLVGGSVQKASCPEPRAACLEIRVPGKTHRLYLCAEADRTRLHRVARRPPSPEAPFALQGLLRKELVGRRLAGLRTIEGDRVVVAEFEGRGKRRALVAELTGRHGNLFVLDGDETILGSAVENLSARRDLFPGKPYLPPRPRPEGRAGGVRFPATKGSFPLSAAIEAAYARLDQAAAAAQKRRLVLAPLKTKRERIGRTMVKVRAELDRTAEAEAHRRFGELLIRNLGRIPRGSRSATLVEYGAEGENRVEVPLDPALSPRANAERHFHLYKRLARGAERARERLASLERTAAQLDRRIEEVGTAGTAALARIEVTARPASPGRRAGETRGKPYREILTLDGTRIWIGRSARDNDALTFRHARGRDLWFHARDVSGAHVVLRCQGEPSEAARADAALLAAHFSDARGEPVVDVSWTGVKNVQKPKGAPPGQVAVSAGRTLRVRADPERLERLLGDGRGRS